MSDPIKPALTENEWDGCETIWPVAALSTTTGGDLTITSADLDDQSFVRVPPDYRHAVAALALYKQEYGFTHDDVRHLRMYAAMFDGARGGQLASIADRIAALLPP